MYAPNKRVNVCVDKYELTLSEKSSKPKVQNWGSIKGIKPIDLDGVEEAIPSPNLNYYQCKSICKAQGKRMLSDKEWKTACEGTPITKCNRYQPHPVVRMLDRDTWVYKGVNCKKKRNTYTEHCMNDPRLVKLNYSIAKNGDFDECVSKHGVYHMVGNLGEWVSNVRKKGSRLRGRFNGGLFPQPKSSCEYTTIAHGPSYQDYSIGCRCGKRPQRIK